MSDESERNKRVKAIMDSPSYRRAYEDVEFLTQSESRELRLLAEYIKPETQLRRHKILSTIIVFGSARILPPDVAQEKLREAQKKLAERPHSADFKREVAAAQEKVAMSGYYEKARKFAELISRGYQMLEFPTERSERFLKYVVCTGGGPGIMEAANRGAADAGGVSVGLNITLPHEQKPNPYITPDLCFQFHYFSIRKLHFLLRAAALVAFPGGFGTFDELFEGLTLRQTGKMQKLPIVLFGEDFWRKCVNFEYLVETGMISPEDLELFKFVDTPEEAVEAIIDFYEKRIVHGM